MLAEAAEVAGYAPSVHNTQPWRWRVTGDRMNLLADRDRQPSVADPQVRLLNISCGAALHHATVALAAEGWQANLRARAHKRDGDLTITSESDTGTKVTWSARLAA
jgi:hypothetical protein